MSGRQLAMALVVGDDVGQLAGDIGQVAHDASVIAIVSRAITRAKAMRQEEAEYWLAVQQQRHAVAAGLQELGGSKIRTLALRGESPCTVQTDACFTGIDELGRRLMAASGLTGTSILTRDGAASEPSDGVSALVGDLESLQVVLTAGHFESAEGFTISNDRRVATFDRQDEKASQTPEEPLVTLRLTWK